MAGSEPQSVRQASIERAREWAQALHDEPHHSHCPVGPFTACDCFRATRPEYERAEGVLALASALADAERQRDEAVTQGASLIAGAEEREREAVAAAEWQCARAEAAEAALADTQEALRRIEAEHMSPMSDIARAAIEEHAG